MKPLLLTRIDLKIAAMSISSFLKATASKVASLKANSLEYKVWCANTDIKAKLDIADKLYDLNPDRTDVEVALDRSQLKVLIATLVHTLQVQNRVMGEYDKRDPDHPSFANEEGRTKEHYVTNLTARIGEVKSVIEKLKGVL